MPGTSSAVLHWPFCSLTTNAWKLPEESRYAPPAAQLPAVGHDKLSTWASPPTFRAAMPGTSCAAPQMPPCAVTTTGSGWPATALTAPPAVQLPADGHETARTWA